MIMTARLMLMPATVALARAELRDRGEFARLLPGSVPDNWPPESTVDALPLFSSWLEAAPDRVGWFGWYALTQIGIADSAVLIGGGGFMGPPQDGAVQIGYSVLPQFQRQGYATEMVGGLVRWVLAQPGVDRVAAETEWANPASTRVLEKVGFIPAGSAADPRGMRFELRGQGISGLTMLVTQRAPRNAGMDTRIDTAPSAADDRHRGTREARRDRYSREQSSSDSRNLRASWGVAFGRVWLGCA